MSTAPSKYVREAHKILNTEDNVLMVYPSINAAKRASRQFQAGGARLVRGTAKPSADTSVVQVKEVRQ